VMIKIIKIFFSLSLLYSCAAFSYQPKNVTECEESFKETLELSQCFDLIKNLTDKELQTWINNQKFILEEFALVTGRRSALGMFERSQRNFITYRENNCRWQYLHISPSTRAALAYKKCYIFLTTDRINELSKLNK